MITLRDMAFDSDESESKLDIFNHENFQDVPDARAVEGIEADMPHQEPSLLPSRMENPVTLEEDKMSKPYSSMYTIHLNKPYFPEKDDQMNMPINTTEMHHEYDFRTNIILGTNATLPSLNWEQTPAHVETQSQAILSAELVSVDKKQLETSLSKLEKIQEVADNPGQQALGDCKTIGYSKTNDAHLEQQHCRRDKRLISMKQKLKKNSEHKRHTNSQEIRGNPLATFLKNQVEQKSLPNFESFTVEDEEGAGGYSTVYRAQRNHDGVKLAIKCPRSNANRHQIKNELRMLERFGGKNFVIKYEGSFKYENADCLVLEHFEHDRPEVLKKEIDVFQLQWYGYCLLKALASLHKQEVVHRDVKPGNFLFSCKVNRGYLIDFNLAMDLHQRYRITDKSAMSYNTGFNHVPLPHAKFLPPGKSRKYLTTKAFEAVNQEVEKGYKSISLSKNLKRKTNETKEHPDMSNSKKLKIQGVDGSGITLGKNATSPRIPSAEKLREPLPCHGRKELISLAQQTMQKGPTNDIASTSPGSNRKRIAAPPEIVYLTPMPLQHSTGIAVAGAGLIKSKGKSEPKKEGPCVGTRGFRAPEVLFKSPYQGPKVDVWSAGVTLLNLINGRSPFGGEPDQNIKDIAKLRGSEDLWEVAKLHNRESSFPAELLDMQFLLSKKLREWCELHTRRPEFLEIVPRSLFDLVDKCLTVNPRLRISAEEALRHEFFAPCRKQLRRQRLLRRGLSLNSETALVLNTQP